MRRVIFVDDEPRILQGLRRQLRPLRKEWDLSFAESGDEALAAMESSTFDLEIRRRFHAESAERRESRR